MTTVSTVDARIATAFVKLILGGIGSLVSVIASTEKKIFCTKSGARTFCEKQLKI